MLSLRAGSSQIAGRESWYSRVVERSSFDTLAELFARDIDRDLLRRSMAKTPTERIRWLEEMQAFAEEARKARDATARADRDSD